MYICEGLLVRDLKSEAELVVALSGRRRYLQSQLSLQETGKLRNILKKRNVYRYFVREGAGSGGDPVIAEVAPEIAQPWIDAGRREASRFHGPAWNTWHIPEFSGFRDWVECGDRFIVGDTIRWEESVSTCPDSSTWCGMGEVIAEVVDDKPDDGMAWLYVIDAVVISGPGIGLQVLDLKSGTVIERRRSLLAALGVGRLLWADEAARRRKISILPTEAGDGA